MSKAQELKQRAKAAEQKGDIEDAVRLFLAAQDVEEAARVYMSAGRFDQAARLLFRAAGVPLDKLSGATPEQKKMAIRAAICFAKAGDVHHAVGIFLATGESRRAIETLEKAGDPVAAARLRAQVESGDARVASSVATSTAVASAKYGAGLKAEQEGDLPAAFASYLAAKSHGDAARVARKMGRHADAAQCFEEAGLFYEAGVCWSDAQDPRRCLGALVRVARDHPKYRACCVKVVELCSLFNEIGLEADQFVARFVSAGVQSAAEVETFLALGRLYSAAGFPENARECFQKVLAAGPNPRAQQALEDLQRELRGSSMAYEKIVREDAAFRGDTPKARTPAAWTQKAGALPDLPDLPDLPPLPGQGGPGTGTQFRGSAPNPRGDTVYDASPRPPTGKQAGVPPPPPAAISGRTQLGVQGGAGGTGSSTGLHAAPTGTHAAPPASGDPGVLDLSPGAIIADRYKIEKQIGQGGTASVFRATDLELEEVVALKVFTVVIDDPDLIRRFKQELSVARQLSHPNIVRLHDIGMHRAFRFLTMELLGGTDLASVIEKGRVPLATAVDYLIQACNGLQLAHDRGIVHRDIKPENFFVTDKGVLKVMDFGIAKNTQASKRTQAGFIAGTPPYMSPEQISGFADVSHLADVYSLGIVAYELFTGSVPFTHEEMMPLLMMHLTQAPEPPKTRNPGLPDSLNELVLRLLEKQPNMRVQSCRELAEELMRLKPGLPKGPGGR